MIEKNLGILLRELRIGHGLKMKDVARHTGIDQALISKIERGVRIPTESQIVAMVSLFPDYGDKIRQWWLADKVYDVVSAYPQWAQEAMALAEPRIDYLQSVAVLNRIELSEAIIAKLDYLDSLKQQWDSRRPLKGIQLQKLKEFLRTEYTYESNRIEGNTLTLSETHLVINEGITVAGKSLNEHLEAINHAEAIGLIEDLVEDKIDLNEYTLLQVHGLILRGIDRKYAGRYRDVPVRIGGSQHLPPEPYLIDKMMEDFFLHYQNHRKTLHPIILAAEMHERLVSIHPFIDGNGRTARLIMNFILLRNGFTIANLKGNNASRLDYYKALEKVQVDNEPKHFYHLIIDTLTDCMEDVLKMV